MLLFPNCKINIGLYITGKREDGFHNLESIFYPVPFRDALEILPSEEFSFQSSGFNVTATPEENICVKAYHLLKEKHDIPPVKMFLLKNIPSGAGLGGGSSDAAYTLKILDELFDLKLSVGKLEEYAAILGSDCPFFIKSLPTFVKGRGEVLEQINFSLKGKFITIIHPEIHISTKEAFSHIQPQKTDSTLLVQALYRPINTWQETIKNDFEPYVFSKYPVLQNIKDTLLELGADYSSMSGSGSAIYSISEKELDVKNLFSKYTTWSGKL